MQLEAENSQVRRNHDELLGELDKIKLNKTSGDSDALVQSEGLRGELATALDRAGLAEQRTQIVSRLPEQLMCVATCMTLACSASMVPRPAVADHKLLWHFSGKAVCRSVLKPTAHIQ